MTRAIWGNAALSTFGAFHFEYHRFMIVTINNEHVVE